MGRDGFLPGAWFARVDARRGVPWVNTLLIGALSLLGAFLIRYRLAAELLNFGAFLGFLGVNAAVIAEYGVRRRGSGGRRPVLDVLMPGLGFVFCLVIWLSLAKTAKLAGGIWLVVGFAYLTLLTRGFRVAPRRWDFSEAA
jgi:amino acid transporter